ncbi:MAG: glycosyl transferase family 2 [Verrucomicrobia bacterium]|nr:glycosyl transferase family 2 [Verrucomicrobiota bacterium]
MVGVNNASLFFADRAIFNEISFIINKQDRIGLVGRNGAGKSTMLKTLAGLQALDSGTVSKPMGLTVGYLPQDMDFISGRTVWKETESAFENNLKIESRIERINHELASRTDYESEDYLKLLDELNDLNMELGLLDASTIEARVEKILLGLGFIASDFERITDEFSGGWRMRIELAKILLRNADLLLLDEPTNHLDIESIQWLEDFLKTYAGSVVIISHDRAFLDNLTKRTVEISLGKVYDYKAPYTKYLQLRQERREQELAAYQNQQKQIKDTERFIERFRAKATKAVQVQSRIKHLERMDKIEVEEEDTSGMRFSFPPAPHSGKVTITVKDLKKEYDDKLVFDQVNLMLERGEKVSLVGKNGEGKSTFSRLVIGEQPTSGTIELGYQVKIGYFAQNQAEILDKNKTVFETIDDVAKGEVRKKVRSLLGSFLFSGEDAEKKVAVLSGGERARLAMCKLLLEPVNLLILDEPTNHLDIKSKDILKDALKRYDGTMILISHDRDFLKGLTDKLFEFSKGEVKEHLGGIDEFLASKRAESITEWEEQKTTAVSSDKKGSKSISKNNYQDKKNFKKELRMLKSEISKAENKIEKLEEKLKGLNIALKAPDAYSDNQLLADWKTYNDELEVIMKIWEEKSEKLTSVEKQLKKFD